MGTPFENAYRAATAWLRKNETTVVAAVTAAATVVAVARSFKSSGAPALTPEQSAERDVAMAKARAIAQRGADEIRATERDAVIARTAHLSESIEAQTRRIQENMRLDEIRRRLGGV